MDELKRKFDAIPWSSAGRETPIAKLGRSLVPLGFFSQRLPREVRYVKLGDEGYELALMEIAGTGIQVGRGKYLTCWHVCQHLPVQEGRAYLQATLKREDGVWLKTYWPIGAQISFIDPRTEAGNPLVDAGLVISTPKDTPELPRRDYVASWGDSTSVGVGDKVLIGGYPLGTSLFLATNTNRGIVQPTFYDGIVSAVLPATRAGETRLFQLSSVALGGISGGAVCNPDTGEILGMVTSGLESTGGNALPITYAIPSEVLQPWCDAISFEVKSGEIWR